jgi:hypothetical protein
MAQEKVSAPSASHLHVIPFPSRKPRPSRKSRVRMAKSRARIAQNVRCIRALATLLRYDSPDDRLALILDECAAKLSRIGRRGAR